MPHIRLKRALARFCHSFAMIVHHIAFILAAASHVSEAKCTLAQCMSRIRMQGMEGDDAMEITKAAKGQAIEGRVWRDLAQLAVEGLAIGLFVSLVLGLAVFAVAVQAPVTDTEAAVSARPLAAVR